MALQNLVGAGIWLPMNPLGFDGSTLAASDSALLDADEEEYQIIGNVTIAGGGSKTFGTSGSKISWLPGASITFLTDSTVRVGVKKSTTVDAGNGPVARATIGAAAFDVYDDLVGGTDTITSTTWRDDAMSAGTPYTVADGELIAVCFHLETTGGSPSVKIRQGAGGVATGFPVPVLVTSGPTYTGQAHVPNIIITFDDGTLGWIEPTGVFSIADTASATVGSGNIFGNIFQVPFACKVDAIAAILNPSTNAANFALELYSTPLGTPALIESIARDANTTLSVGSNRHYVCRLATPRTLTINTDYAVGVNQTTATAVTVVQRVVTSNAYWKSLGMGGECYGANSTGGATFADAAATGLRRYGVYVRISALDDGAGAGGGLIRHVGMAGGCNA